MHGPRKTPPSFQGFLSRLFSVFYLLATTNGLSPIFSGISSAAKTEHLFIVKKAEKQ
jgi:hypothetical protein